jgi:hypothetical protein
VKKPFDAVPEAGRALGDDQVARVFRALADEHCAKRAALERDLAWKNIAGRARERPARGRTWLRRFLLPAAAAICVVCAVIGWTYRPRLEYEVRGAVSVSDGEIRAGSGGASLVFSDGSTLVARPDSLLSLSIVGQQAALTRLLRGTLSVSVHHDERADWRFLAGPYEVRVVGTRFDLAWAPETSLLTLTMHEGSVRVTGPGKFDQTLVAGETLRRSGLEEPLRASRDPELRTNAQHAAPTLPEVPTATTLRPVKPLVSGLRAPEAAPRDEWKDDALPEEDAVEDGAMADGASKEDVALHRALSADGLHAIVPPEDDWPELVSRGRFAEVVEGAEREGADVALATRSVADLKALAQAARYTGKTALALRSWTGIRNRFQGHPAALQAAFFLGRIYDELDQPERARAWLETYLAEAPAGTYASEALGRRLGLAKRLGNHRDVVRLAHRYLEVFPSGAYARTAQALLSEEPPGSAR